MKADQQLIRTVEVHDRAGNVVGTKEVVLYAGLLSQAHEEGLAKVKTAILQVPTEENGRLAIVKAEVETTKGLFEALGDACPENVDEFLAPHLIRVAETRAKARALRDAVNVGVASFEELDGVSLPRDPSPGSGAAPSPTPTNRIRGNGPAQARTARPATGSAARARPAGQSRGGNGQEAMTEAQRRYLFRLMAGQGLQGETAHEELKQRFGVPSLTQVTKTAATVMIDRLLNPPPVASGASDVPDF